MSLKPEIVKFKKIRQFSFLLSHKLSRLAPLLPHARGWEGVGGGRAQVREGTRGGKRQGELLEVSLMLMLLIMCGFSRRWCER